MHFYSEDLKSLAACLQTGTTKMSPIHLLDTIEEVLLFGTTRSTVARCEKLVLNSIYTVIGYSYMTIF